MECVKKVPRKKGRPPRQAPPPRPPAQPLRLRDLPSADSPEGQGVLSAAARTILPGDIARALQTGGLSLADIVEAARAGVRATKWVSGGKGEPPVEVEDHAARLAWAIFLRDTLDGRPVQRTVKIVHDSRTLSTEDLASRPGTRRAVERMLSRLAAARPASGEVVGSPAPASEEDDLDL